MSYRVEYGPPIPAQYIKRSKPLRIQIMTAVFLLLFTLLVRQFFPSGTRQLRQILLPETHSITQDALDALMSDLRNGEPLGDAVTAFCVYIIDHDETIPN